MTRYAWAKWGDVNGFFGMVIDNVAVMMILAGALSGAGFNQDFVLTRMIPGSALGVLIGDLVYTWMAFRLARRTGRSDVTAMPLGIDTPSTFAVAFLVLIPSFNEGMAKFHDKQAAMEYAWHIGAVVLVLVGVFKTLFAPVGNKVRAWVPRAGLLGSLAAIAICLIAFMPLVSDIATVPLVGLLALTVILATLVAHRPLPGNIPGALAALALGVGVYYLCLYLERFLGPLVPHPHPVEAEGLHQAVSFIPSINWEQVWQPALAKLPVILPFALATIVGGIDCTESAAAAGDEYDTRTILLTEGLASLAAGLCGGVLQNTPYIGHPAYKAMGSRAAYTLATGLFIGAAGFLGWFPLMFNALPHAAMFPILVFVGLEITAQSFHATPIKHYPALALAILPATAALGNILVGQALGMNAPNPQAAGVMQTLRCLSNGFIVTSLLWGATLAALLDGRLKLSAVYLLVAATFALFGIIHSPLPAAPVAFPHTVLDELRASNLWETAKFHTPYHWAGAYGLCAAFILCLDFLPTPSKSTDRAAGA